MIKMDLEYLHFGNGSYTLTILDQLQYFFCSVGSWSQHVATLWAKVHALELLEAFFGPTWAKDHCATQMEKHLEPKKGAQCWKLTEHLQNLKRSEQSVDVFFSSHQHNFCFVWTSHEITA